MTPSALIIGIGNPDYGDDAAGLECIRLLHEIDPPNVSLRTDNGDAATLLDAFQEAQEVWLIDAVCSGAPLGTLHPLNAHDGPLPADWFSSVSTHDFGLAEAVELGRSLDQLPPKLFILGIEAAHFAPGTPLSPELTPALNKAVHYLLQHLAPPTPHA